MDLSATLAAIKGLRAQRCTAKQIAHQLGLTVSSVNALAPLTVRNRDQSTRRLAAAPVAGPSASNWSLCLMASLFGIYKIAAPG